MCKLGRGLSEASGRDFVANVVSLGALDDLKTPAIYKCFSPGPGCYGYDVWGSGMALLWWPYWDSTS